MIGYSANYDTPVRRLEEPPGSAVLIIGLGDPVAVTDPSGNRRALHSFAVPIGMEPSIAEQGGRQEGVEVRLNPLVARRVLGVPMHELSPHGTELEDIVGPAARELAERMAQAATWADRYALVRDALMARAAAAPPPRRELAWAWRRMHDPRARVEQVAREIGWSRRHLSARFRDAVGVTPKEAARVLRFRRVVEGLRAADRPSLGELALDAGYYDQAHLNRDFRAFAGCAPAQFPSVQDSVPELA